MNPDEMLEAEEQLDRQKHDDMWWELREEQLKAEER